MDFVAWPLAVTFIVVFALLLFRTPIAGLIARISKVKLPGVHADVSVRAQLTEQPADLAAAPALATSPSPGLPPPNPITSEIEASTLRVLEESFPKDRELQILWAVRAYALSDLEKAHEANYRLILGSQIAALKNLNQCGGRQPISALKANYDQAAAIAPDAFAKFNFDAWRHFLTRIQYIRELGDGTAELMPYGKDFLNWMTARGVYENKAF